MQRSSCFKLRSSTGPKVLICIVLLLSIVVRLGGFGGIDSSPGCDGRSEARTQGASMLFCIGAPEDAASGRAARPGGTDLFRQTLLKTPGGIEPPSARFATACLATRPRCRAKPPRGVEPLRAGSKPAALPSELRRRDGADGGIRTLINRFLRPVRLPVAPHPPAAPPPGQLGEGASSTGSGTGGADVPPAAGPPGFEPGPARLELAVLPVTPRA